MTGRPTELTPEIEKKVLDAVRAGNRASASFRYAGINEKTGLEWLARGRGEHSQRKANKLYADFAEKFAQAEAECEVMIVAQWKRQIPENWQAARDFLGRRYGWNETIKQEHTLTLEQASRMTVEELDAEIKRRGLL